MVLDLTPSKLHTHSASQRLIRLGGHVHANSLLFLACPAYLRTRPHYYRNVFNFYSAPLLLEAVHASAVSVVRDTISIIVCLAVS